jgi:hypothetical protein
MICRLYSFIIIVLFQIVSTAVQFRRLETIIIAFLKEFAFMKMTTLHFINAPILTLTMGSQREKGILVGFSIPTKFVHLTQNSTKLVAMLDVHQIWSKKVKTLSNFVRPIYVK